MIFGIFLFLNSKVEGALSVEGYNGNSTTPPKINAGTCQASWKSNLFCRFQMVNGNARGIRVSFVYYDGKKYEQLGRYLDIWSNHPYGTKNIYYTPVRTGGTKSITGPLSLNNFNTGQYDYWIWKALNLNQKKSEASKQLKSYFLNQEVMEGYALFLTGHSLTGKDKNGNEDDYFKRPNEVADESGKNPASKGYRFFIEPIRGFATKNNEFYVMTWTEYARLAKSEKRITFTKSWFSEEDVLFVSYKDIGIDRVSSCIDDFQRLNKRKCDIPDILPGSYGISGHFLQIIDFSSLLPTESCEIKLEEKQENGESFDEDDYECCEQKRSEIENKYKNVLNSNSVSNTKWCMNIVKTEDEFIKCLQDYVRVSKNNETKLQEYSNEIYNFYQKYPECGSGSSCEEAKKKRDEEYVQCKENLKSHSYWMANKLMGLENRCDQIRDLKTAQIKEKYPVGCIDDDTSTGDKKYSCVYDEKNDIYYGITGEILTGNNREEQYKKECLGKDDPNNPEGPNKPSECDYNNPAYFPSAKCDQRNKECCLEKEQEFKEKALKEGWSDERLAQEIRDWYNEPGMEFRKNCLCGTGQEEPDPEDCTWEDYATSGLTGMGNGKCISSTTYGAHDTENWDCIYKSNKIEKGSSTEIFRDYFIQMSNPYCAVYCREDIGNEGPNGKMIVKAGNHFTVNNNQTSRGIENWAPIHFYSTRTCYTAAGSAGSYSERETGINYRKFKSDWETHNRNAAIAWDSQEIKRIKVDLTDTYKKAGGCGECCGKDCPPGQCGNWWIAEDREYTKYDGKKEKVSIDGWCDYYVTRAGNKRKYELQQYLSEIDYGRALATLKQTEHDILACTDWTKFYDDHYYEYDFPDPEIFIKKLQEISMVMQNNGRDKNNETDRKIIEAWRKMVENMRKITPSKTEPSATRYRKYNSYDEFQKYYEFSPDLKLNYVEGTNPSYNYQNKLKKIEPSYIDENNFAHSYNASKKYRIKCEDSTNNRVPCRLVDTFSYAKIDKVQATYKKDIQYTLPDQVFDVVIKPDGTATSSNGLSLAPNQIAIHLGYSALHTHFMTPTGRYEIGLSWDGYTPKNSKENHGYSHNMDKQIHGTQTYECSYQVHNEIIENKDPKCEGDNCEPIYNNDKVKPCGGENCDPTTLKGLNLIYRPISLTNPFPGIEGSGRRPGSNWKETEENKVIEKYITNNRELKADKLYSEAYPMYQITLTPARIKEIRKYNAYEMKEDRGGYNDWNMDCSGANECKSDFIRKQVENGQDFSKYFREECTMSADRNKKSECCGVGNWNDCAEEDQSRNGGVR